MISAVSDGRWHWQLGDPDPGSIFVTRLYLLSAAVCYAAARSCGRRGSLCDKSPMTAHRFWLVLTGLLVCLGVNKQADFQSLLTLFGRDFLRSMDLYDVRRAIQATFVAGIAVIACTSIVACWWIVRRLSWHPQIATAGLALQSAFIMTRAASFHHVDTMLGLQLGNLKLNLLFESTGLLVILLAAILCLLKKERTTERT